MNLEKPRARRSAWKTALIAIGVVGIAIVCFLFGMHRGARQAIAWASAELEGTQAMLAFNRIPDERRIQALLAFNRIPDERRIQALLAKGCVAAAQKQIDIDEDKDTETLADFFREKDLPAWTRKYVADRDPKLVKTLTTFKSKYGSTWEQPDCKNTTSWSSRK